uniref:Fork-head domain-containing protein n=1 Tax=Onchocerca volvulus TaxID=6282 RepID=A0A8R1TN88_ONCVO
MDSFGCGDFLSYSNSILSQKSQQLFDRHYHRHQHQRQRQQRQQHKHSNQYDDNHQSKPQPSYIGLIAMAILSSREQKMVLSEICQWIIDNYSYFRSRSVGWRNSIRHNLSLNDCFIKAGRSANGKGHYWAIHPANLDDFKRGDFRRRRAQRKVRRHMGLMVNEDECSDDSPISTPTPVKKSFTIESILRPEYSQQPSLPFMHTFPPNNYSVMPLQYHVYSNYFMHSNNDHTTTVSFAQ